MTYLKGTKELALKLSADGMNILKWFVDISYTTNADMKSHTESVTTMRKGSIISKSMKQKLNKKSARNKN